MAGKSRGKGSQLANSGRFADLIEAIDADARLLGHWPLTGGVSAVTTALQIQRSDGRCQKLVVRQHGPRDLARDPDIARHEFQLLQALHDSGIPVPEPVLVDATGEILGKPGIVVEFVEGEIRTASDTPPTAEELSEMAHWLARIHATDLERNDLSFLVSNHYDSADRLDEQPDDSPLIRRICQRLQQIGPIPAANRPALLHGDYWRGNLIWDGSSIAGIVDWEDAMIADPIVELARVRLELAWTWKIEHARTITSAYLDHRELNIDSLAHWDLVMALNFARALPGWGLPEERQREMLDKLEQFIDQSQ
jgi:aminoglycoside phosphotransferase (APT) family kinase protein